MLRASNLFVLFDANYSYRNKTWITDRYACYMYLHVFVYMSTHLFVYVYGRAQTS